MFIRHKLYESGALSSQETWFLCVHKTYTSCFFCSQITRTWFLLPRAAVAEKIFRLPRESVVENDFPTPTRLGESEIFLPDDLSPVTLADLPQMPHSWFPREGAVEKYSRLPRESVAETHLPTPTRLGESEISLSSRRPPDPPPWPSTDNDRLQLFWATLSISQIWSAATLINHLNYML